MTNPSTSAWQSRVELISERYLNALAKGDLSAILELFSSTGRVFSPLYGEQSAGDFYTALFADTQTSRLTPIDVLTNTNKRSAAIYFHYEWELAGGEWVSFPVIDHLEFDAEDRITSLRIIYDTQASRPALARRQEKKPRS